MIKVRIFKASNYPVGSVMLKRKLRAFLREKGIVSDCEISVALVGRERMVKLAKKYLNNDFSVHNVLSFTENEVMRKFVYPPGDITRLGEVVVCYPKMVDEAKAEGKRIDIKVWELVEHGTMHLLGYHHS
jgi:probable rRNA maturation factor